MANEEQVEDETKPGAGKFLRMFGVAAGIVMGGVILAAVVFKLFLLPMLSETESEAAATVHPDTISPEAVTVDFDDGYVNVIMEDKNVPASWLVYDVSLECANAATASLVEKYRARFHSMLERLHSFKTRKELDDPLVKESIEKQARQEANTLLDRILGYSDPNIRVTAVFHTRYAVQDQL
jgi:flagellar basal body-associated protein FliL